MASKHIWTLKLKLVCIEGLDGDLVTNIEVEGSQDPDRGQRAVNECIAIDMRNMLVMVLESGRIACSTSIEDTIDAFTEGRM